MDVYVAGPMDDATRARMVRAAQDAGHRVVNDPPTPPPRELAGADRSWFASEVERLGSADLLLADVSRPDHDVAWAIAWFLAKGRLAVLTCERKARSSVGHFVRGNPSPWQRWVEYDSLDALAASVRDALRPR